MSRLFLASVLLALAAPLALRADAPGINYVRVDAASVAKSPWNSWARAILFEDEIVEFSDGRSQRLDHRNYVPMTLKSAGTAWIRDDHVEAFRKLPPGTRFSFGGTVDQISRKYYLILDAAYTIESNSSLEEVWTDVLASPPSEPTTPLLDDVTPAPDGRPSAGQPAPAPVAAAPADSFDAPLPDDIDDIVASVSQEFDFPPDSVAVLPPPAPAETPAVETPAPDGQPSAGQPAPSPADDDLNAPIVWKPAAPAPAPAPEELAAAPESQPAADEPAPVVRPLDEPASPAIVPLVSLAPTKGEVQARQAQTDEEAARQAKLRAQARERARQQAAQRLREQKVEEERQAQLRARQQEIARRKALAAKKAAAEKAAAEKAAAAGQPADSPAPATLTPEERQARILARQQEIARRKALAAKKAAAEKAAEEKAAAEQAAAEPAKPAEEPPAPAPAPKAEPEEDWMKPIRF